MKQPLKKVFVVFKTHFDIGFTHLAKEVVSWYGKDMIEDVLKVCRATKNELEGHRYVWTVPSWPMKKTLEIIEKPEIREETEEYLRSGQLVWHGLPFTTHTEVCGLEEFIRGMLISSRLGKTYGRHVRDAKMTDVPGHPWILPTLLHKAGIRFLHLGSNFCATPPDVPRLFWWEGPDGSRLLTYYSKGDYGSDLIPPKDWEYPYWLAMLQTLDNLGAQDTDYLSNMFLRAKRELPGVEISIGTLEDFGEAIIQSGIEIPVVRGDLSDSWIRGVGSAPQGMAQLRGLRYQVEGGQIAQTLMVEKHTHDEAFTLLNDAYEKMLLFSEHTWGMDTKISILPERHYGAPWIGFRFWESGSYDKETFQNLRTYDLGYLKLQDSWQEQLDYLADVNQDLKTMQRLLQGNDKRSLTVFGALGFAARHSLDLSNYLSLGELQYVLVNSTGNRMPVYEDIHGIPRADITLPALGGERYQIVPRENQVCFTAIASKEAEDTVVLENQWIKVVVNLKKGTLSSFFYKPKNREWVDRHSDVSFGQYLYDIYSYQELDDYLRNYLYVLRDWGINDAGKAGYPKEQLHERFTPTNFTYEVKNGQGWGGVTLTTTISDRSIERYGNATGLRVDIVLGENTDYLDITYRLMNKQPTPFIESGHFSFPLKTEMPEYRINKLGCVQDPQKDVIADCNMDLYCLEGWTAVEDQGCGFAIAVKEAPLMSYGKPGILRFDRDPEIRESILLMQGFNNAWGTNFPQWSQGTMEFSYRLIPYKGKWQESHIWEKAEEFRCIPFVAMGTAVIQGEILSSNLEGLRVLTLKPSEDTKGYILRLSDQTGKQQMRTIRFALPLKNAALCNLLEEGREALTISKKNEIVFFSRPYDIHTIYFELYQ